MDQGGVEITPLDVHEVIERWPNIKDGIEEALDPAVIGPEIIMHMIQRHDLLMVEISVNEIPMAWATLEKVFHPRAKMLKVFTLHGEYMSLWLASFENYVVNIAKQQDCIGVETYTRPGIVEALKPFGYKPSKILVRRMFNGQ